MNWTWVLWRSPSPLLRGNREWLHTRPSELGQRRQVAPDHPDHERHERLAWPDELDRLRSDEHLGCSS